MKKYLFILFVNIAFTQNNLVKSDFFKIFNYIKTPYIIDEIQYNSFFNNPKLELKKINYNDFIKNSYFEEDNRQIYTVVDSSMVSLYAIGKFKFDKIDCLVVLSKEKGNNNFSEILLMFYNDENRLINSNTISLPIANDNDNFSAIIFSNKGIFVNKTDLNLFSLSKKYFQFNYVDVIQDSLKIDKREFDEYVRNHSYNKIEFNNSFFTKKHNFLDLIFFKPFIKSNIVMSIKNNPPRKYKSYFIDAFVLENNRKIYFFKTDYFFEGYKHYSIIGYQILSDDGKYNKNAIISEYVVSEIGKQWTKSAKIDVNKNYLVIQFNNGFENVTEKFKLK